MAFYSFQHLAVDIVKFGCSLIPSRDLAGQCKQAYSFFVTEVFWGTRDFLTNFTPKDFCDYIYLCATDKREASEFLALVTGKHKILTRLTIFVAD